MSSYLGNFFCPACGEHTSAEEGVNGSVYFNCSHCGYRGNLFNDFEDKNTEDFLIM